MKKLAILRKATITAAILTSGALSSVEVMAAPTSTPVPQSTSGYSSTATLVSTPVPNSASGFSSAGPINAYWSPASTVTVNCVARTIKANGQINGSWLGSWCGAVVYFKNTTTNQETARYVACALTSSTTSNAKCSITKKYSDLNIPASLSEYKVSVPEMPDAWPNLGTWRGYTKAPLKNVVRTALGSGPTKPGVVGSGGAGSTFATTIDIEHELVTHQ